MPSPTATPISGATDWIREAVLTASPARNPSPEAALTPRRTSASPVLIPTRSLQRCSADRGQLLGVLADPKAGAHGALGVVLVGGGDAEDPHDRIADELLDHPAVCLDLCAGHLEVGGEHLVHVLGIGGLRGGGEPDQVAEQGGDDLAFLGDGAGRRRTERRAALRCRTSTRPGSRVPQEGHAVIAGAYAGMRALTQRDLP